MWPRRTTKQQRACAPGGEIKQNVFSANHFVDVRRLLLDDRRPLQVSIRHDDRSKYFVDRWFFWRHFVDVRILFQCLQNYFRTAPADWALATPSENVYLGPFGHLLRHVPPEPVHRMLGSEGKRIFEFSPILKKTLLYYEPPRGSLHYAPPRASSPPTRKCWLRNPCSYHTPTRPRGPPICYDSWPHDTIP